MYLNRTLELNKGTKDASTIAEMDFAKLPEPKVLLGAPGSGKTTVCQEIAKQLGGQFAYAEDVANGLFDKKAESPDKILVIDGLDEVSSETIPKAFVDIIKNSKNLGYTNWLISCRACEWEFSLFGRQIKEAFGDAPQIASLGELSDEEVKRLLELFGYSGKLEQFLKDAEANEANEFLRNPQTLEMLVKAVQSDGGWPKTKTDLFLYGCKFMAAEGNEIRQANDKNRPTPEKIIEIAGWICAQMLMSGNRAIALDGKYSEDSPRPADLSSQLYDYDAKKIEATCKTKLFKTAGKGSVEPAHRTIAEFLAGDWLVEQFRANPCKLSPRRVMNYFASGTETIPPSLQGLYAWITSLDNSERRQQNIKSDPYGCLRYGDLSGFSDNELITLLEALKALEKTDPFFRGWDRGTQFGRSLGQEVIKGKFVEIISDADTSPHLRITLLQAIQGTDLARAIVDELKAIVLNEKIFSREREEAIAVLRSVPESIDWEEIAEYLLKSGTADSLKLSIDQIISYKPDLFCGEKIAEHLIAHEKAMLDKEGEGYIGMGFRVSKEFSDEQVLEIAQLIAAEIPREYKTFRRGSYQEQDFYSNLEEVLIDLLRRMFEQDSALTADVLWPLISRLSGGITKIRWEEVETPWFATHNDIRREIQTRALNEERDNDSGWRALFELSDISEGLDLCESDVEYHLEALISAKDKPLNWEKRWKNLVRWGKRYGDGVLKLAKKQAKDYPELEPVLKELLVPQSDDDDFEKKRQERQRKWDEKRLADTQERHANFDEFREDMATGKSLGALYQAATAALNGDTDLKDTVSPKERIKEMVGTQNLEAAISGFKMAGQRDDIPSVRECAKLRVNNKAYHLEAISLALCVLMQEAGESLDSLPQKTQLCALSAAWFRGCSENDVWKSVKIKLEYILFEDRETKLNFAKDIIEPGFEAGKSVWELPYITTNELFADVLPDLAIGWLNKFEKVPDDAVWHLLQVAVRIAEGDTNFANLVETRLQQHAGGSEEQWHAWHATAFVLNFERFRRRMAKFANENKNHLWSFKRILDGDSHQGFTSPDLNAEQISFLLKAFAKQWPIVSWPISWVGSNNPWDASNWLQNLIRILEEKASEEAISQLKDLADSGSMGTYQNYVQHSLANAKGRFAEIRYSETTLEGVRNILSSGKPANVSDIQTLFIEELENYQEKIRTGEANTDITFWDRGSPHGENHCRDRLIEGLEEKMEKYGIALHKENEIANKKKPDLWLSYDKIRLPVEIKGQWHPDIWTAARQQLEEYSKNYRTDGFGVYLVIWHGPVDIEGKKAKKVPKGKQPESADEMRQALHDNSGDLSPKTKIVVLDVSIPASKKK